MNILNKIADKSFWQRVRENGQYDHIIEELHKHYERDCVGEIETAKFSKFRLFKDVGDRTSYDKVFFQRQHRLYISSVMALLYPEKDEYLTLLQDTIWEICDMYVWALPAHINDITVNDNAQLDLDSTSMSFALSLIYKMLSDRLHPLIKSRVEAELDRRLIKPFLEKMWHWEDRYNNWTAVCSASVGCTFMIMRPDLFPLIKDRINENMRKYISSYKSDGVCVEGAGYWSYGFGYFFEYARMLIDFTRGECDLLHNEKIENISSFLQKLFLDRDVLVSYGDCGMNVIVSAGFMYSLKSVFPSVEIPPFSRLEFNPHYYPFFLRAFTDFDPSFGEIEFSSHAEYYMKDCGWFVKRTPNYGFSARGGCNGESHNHNDVGSFILSKDNKQLLIDMGSRPYTRQYFEDDKRYTFLETSSRGHNVPVVNGKFEANVREAYPTTSFENGVFSVDFKVAYDISELKSLVRDFSFTDTTVTVTDKFDIEGDFTFTERLVSFVEPVISEGRIDYGKAVVTFDPKNADARCERDLHVTALNTDGSVKSGVDVFLVSIDVKREGSFEFVIEVK